MSTKSQEPKTPTKKHLARSLREQRERRRMLIIASIVFGLILLVLIMGVLDQTVFKDNRPVAKVNDQTIRTEDFVKRVKLQRMNRNSLAMQYYQFGQSLGADFSQYIQSIQTELSNPVQFGNGVLDFMIDEIVINNYAKENGITVSEEAVQEELQNQFGYYPNGTPTPENTPTPYATSTMSAEQYLIITATPTAEPTEPVSADETEVVEATPATEVEPTEVVDAEPTEEPTPFPTATPYTQEAFEENFNTSLETYKEIGVSREDLIDGLRNQLIYEKVFDKITADVPTEEEQVWARHILVGSLEEALAVKSRLEAGEDWGVIAAEVSTDDSNKDRGGDLGWFGKGVMDPAFEEAAFALEVGEISNPVQSSFGWHIIQMVGKEVRPIDNNRLQQLQSQVFADWLAAEKEKYTIEKFDDRIAEVVPSEPAFDTRLLQ